MATYNRETFFSGYRTNFGSLNQSQVEGLNFLLDKLEQDSFSLKQTAYILATIHHETGVKRNGELQTFQPIKELRGKPGSKIRVVQDKYWGSGYYGRGYIQLTWEDNYRKFGIAATPEKAYEPETAYEIATRGMREGMFTGKKLSDYINGKADYFNARKIVNGLDKAAEIAAKAKAYEAILKEASEPSDTNGDKGVTTSPDKLPGETEGAVPPADAVEVKASETSWKARLGSLSIPAGAATAVGAVGGFVKNIPPFAWFALAGVVVAAMVIGFLVWRENKREAHERTLKVLDAGADREKNNLRLV